MWGATPPSEQQYHPFSISIHAPRVGSDKASAASDIQSHSHFNPRSPCGERLLLLRNIIMVWLKISIHAPRVGSDDAHADVATDLLEFQSTLPVWGATCMNVRTTTPHVFQSTLPVWGATASASYTRTSVKFQSTLPVWGATRKRK